MRGIVTAACHKRNTGLLRKPPNRPKTKRVKQMLYVVKKRHFHNQAFHPPAMTIRMHTPDNLNLPLNDTGLVQTDMFLRPFEAFQGLLHVRNSVFLLDKNQA